MRTLRIRPDPNLVWSSPVHTTGKGQTTEHVTAIRTAVVTIREAHDAGLEPPADTILFRWRQYGEEKTLRFEGSQTVAEVVTALRLAAQARMEEVEG